MGFLAEDSLFFESFAVGPGHAVQLDADPHALATDFFDGGTLNGLELREEVGAQLGGALHHLLFDEHAQSGSGNGAA